MQSSITVNGVGAAGSRTAWVAFRQGAVTCMLNPKAYLFTLAVYPQFIRAEYGAVWSQALAMGGLTALVQVAVYGGLALAAAQSRDWLLGSPLATIWFGRIAGGAFVVVAGLTLWHGVAG